MDLVALDSVKYMAHNFTWLWADVWPKAGKGVTMIAGRQGIPRQDWCEDNQPWRHLMPRREKERKRKREKKRLREGGKGPNASSGNT